MQYQAPPLCCALLAALLPVIPAHAADARVQAADLPPIEVDQDELEPSARFEYGHRATGPSGDYLGLMATRDAFALLYEHEETALPGAAYSMNRVGFLIGGPSRPSGVPGGQLHVGLGKTEARAAQQVSVVSLLMHANIDFINEDLGTGIEFKFAVPVNQLSALNSASFTREADGEAGWFYRWKHATLRFGYRVLAVNTTSRSGGWYTGFGLVY